MSANLDEKNLALYFRLFNEIAIIGQLSQTKLDNIMPKGLLNSHFNVLNHLVRLGDGKTPLSLANAFQLPKTTMTHTLSGLEKHNLVTIRPNPDDGRSKQVWLTQKGIGLRLQTIMQAAPILSQSLQGFSSEQIESLAENLAEIRKILDSNR